VSECLEHINTVLHLYVSCYVTVNKPVLSYLLSRLLPHYQFRLRLKNTKIILEGKAIHRLPRNITQDCIKKCNVGQLGSS
jgi:hypothetical protein